MATVLMSSSEGARMDRSTSSYANGQSIGSCQNNLTTMCTYEVSNAKIKVSKCLSRSRGGYRS